MAFGRLAFGRLAFGRHGVRSPRRSVSTAFRPLAFGRGPLFSQGDGKYDFTLFEEGLECLGKDEDDPGLLFPIDVGLYIVLAPGRGLGCGNLPTVGC